MKSILTRGFALCSCSITSLGFCPSGLCFPAGAGAPCPTSLWVVGGDLPAEPGQCRALGDAAVSGSSPGEGGSEGPSCDAGLCWWLNAQALLYTIRIPAGSGTAPVLPLLLGKHPSLSRLPPPPLPPTGQNTSQAFGHVFFFPPSPSLRLKTPPSFIKPALSFLFPPPFQHHHLPPTTSTSLSQPATAGESQLAPIVLSLGPKLKFMTS